MKAIRTNDQGEEIVYVQNGDLKYLANSGIPLSTTIHSKILNNRFNIFDDKAKEDYTIFSQGNDVEFFKDLNIIIDVDKYNEMTIQEVYRQHLNTMMDQFDEMKYNSASNHNNLATIQCIILQDYQIKSIGRVITNKKNNIPLILPEINNLSKKLVK